MYSAVLICTDTTISFVSVNLYGRITLNRYASSRFLLFRGLRIAVTSSSNGKQPSPRTRLNTPSSTQARGHISHHFSLFVVRAPNHDLSVLLRCFERHGSNYRLQPSTVILHDRLHASDVECWLTLSILKAHPNRRAESHDIALSSSKALSAVGFDAGGLWTVMSNLPWLPSTPP